MRDTETRKDRDIEVVVFDLERVEGNCVCSSCGKRGSNRHSSWIQEIRHLRLWRYETKLRFGKVKVRFPDCGVEVEHLDFLGKSKRITK